MIEVPRANSRRRAVAFQPLTAALPFPDAFRHRCRQVGVLFSRTRTRPIGELRASRRGWSLRSESLTRIATNPFGRIAHRLSQASFRSTAAILQAVGTTRSTRSSDERCAVFADIGIAVAGRRRKFRIWPLPRGLVYGNRSSTIFRTRGNPRYRRVRGRALRREFGTVRPDAVQAMCFSHAGR